MPLNRRTLFAANSSHWPPSARRAAASDSQGLSSEGYARAALANASQATIRPHRERARRRDGEADPCPRRVRDPRGERRHDRQEEKGGDEDVGRVRPERHREQDERAREPAPRRAAVRHAEQRQIHDEARPEHRLRRILADPAVRDGGGQDRQRHRVDPGRRLAIQPADEEEARHEREQVGRRRHQPQQRERRRADRMQERDGHQEEQVDRIAAGGAGLVGPAGQPGQRLHAPPALVAADPRHRIEPQQAEPDGGAEQDGHDRRHEAALARRPGPALSRPWLISGEIIYVRPPPDARSR